MNSILLASTVAAGFVLCGLPSQSLPIAYPQDSISISQGSILPLGYFSGVPNQEERRMQMVVPASWLPPTGATVTGIAFRANSSGTIVYDSLRIDLSHHTTTNLDISFAANLPSPQTVVPAASRTVNWPHNQWVEIPFATTFAYDGQSHLVVDLQLIVNAASTFCSHQVAGNPERNDLPLGPAVAGGIGSGAVTAATGSFMKAPLQFRLLVSGTPTMTLLSNRGGAFNNTFAIGTTVNVNVNAPVGQLYGTLVNLGYQVVPVPIAPLGGEAWVLGNTLFLGVTAGAVTTNGIVVPNDAGLVGLPLAMQSVVVDLTSLQGGFTGAADFVVRP